MRPIELIRIVADRSSGEFSESAGSRRWLLEAVLLRNATGPFFCPSSSPFDSVLRSRELVCLMAVGSRNGGTTFHCSTAYDM